MRDKWHDLKRLYEAGLSLRDIAFLKRCSHEWVRTNLERQGIKLRKRGGQHVEN